MTATEIEALKLAKGYLLTAEGRLYDHVSKTFGWLMATLFAANGGAIIALLGSGKDASLGVLGWFASGLLLSILMGVLTTFWSLLASNRMIKARTSIDVALLTGVPDNDTLNELVARSSLNWKTWVPTYVGVASFACIVGGMLTFACRH